MRRKGVYSLEDDSEKEFFSEGTALLCWFLGCFRAFYPRLKELPLSKTQLLGEAWPGFNF